MDLVLVAHFGHCLGELLRNCRLELSNKFAFAVMAGPGYQADMFERLMALSKDPDAAILPERIRIGFPLGINRTIVHSGVFPCTDDVSASIKASQVNGILLEDWDGSASNYRSFEDAGEKAQAELDRMVCEGRATTASTWSEVVQQLGPEAKLTKLACIVKQREDLSEKVRLVVDMRRSGITGLISLRERLVLPRIADVAESVSALMKSASWGDAFEAMISDFKDAFYSLPLHVEEQPFAVIKGSSLSYLLKTVVFGVACGPLLWARLASWGMRISRAVACCSESRAECFVDDPIVLACGGSVRQRTRSFARYLLSWTVLGV